MLIQTLLALSVAMVLTACDGEKVQEIEWQLPLSVPDDPHASNVGKELPEWATMIEGKAKVVLLQKSTARLFSTILEKGSSKQLEHWNIELLGLAQGLRVKGHTFINDEKVPNPAAYVRLSLDDKLVHEGWLYQDFPELFGMDNSDWKVWVEDVTMPPSPQGDDNMLP